MDPRFLDVPLTVAAGGRGCTPPRAGGLALTASGELLWCVQLSSSPLEYGHAGSRGSGSCMFLLFQSAGHPIGSPGTLTNWKTGLMTCLLIGGEALYSENSKN